MIKVVKGTLLRKFLFLLFVLCCSVQGNAPDKAIHMTDPRDNQQYAVVEIDDIRWMAENLRYEPGGIFSGNSWCYDNDKSNCDKYGRLYDWKAATKACPGGWHLPSNKEWDNLIEAVGRATAGTKLKERTGWVETSIKGTNEFGFAAMPGGYGISEKFYDAGTKGLWWAATECDKGNAYYRYMGSDFENVLPEGSQNTAGSCRSKALYGHSIRCVKD